MPTPSHTPAPPPRLELVLEHSDWLTRLADSLVRDAAVASELSDRALRRLQPRSDVRDERAFLARVVDRLARRHRRGEARRRRRERVAATARATGVAPAAADLAAQLEVQRLLLDVVSSLREPAREVLLLRYYHGRTSAEIARSRGISPAAARKRLERATGELRAELDRRFPDRTTWLGMLAPVAAALPTTTSTSAFLSVGAFKAVTAAAVAMIVAVAALFLRGGGGGDVAPVGGDERIERDVALVGGAAASGDGAFARAERDDESRSAAPAGASDIASEPAVILRLRTPEDAPAARRAVVVVDASYAVTRLETDAGGRVDLGLAPGAERTLVVARPAPSPPHVHRLELVAGDNEVVLPAGSELSGVITLNGDVPEPPLEVTVTSDHPLTSDARLAAIIEEELGPLGRLETAADGRFRVVGLASDWSGTLALPRHVRRRTTPYSFAGADSVHFERPGTRYLLDLVADPVMTARIVEADGQSVVPHASLFVMMHWGDADLRGGYALRADDEGRVEVPLLDRMPDRFELSYSRADGSASTEYVAPAGAFARTLELGDLALVAERGLRFRALDGSGEPVPSAIAFVEGTGARSEPTDARGVATLSGVPESASTFTVVAPGFERSHADVPKDHETLVDVVLAPTSRLLVSIVDAAGDPATRVRVRIEAARGAGGERWARDMGVLGRVVPGALHYSTSAGRGRTSFGLSTDEDARLELQNLPRTQPIVLLVEDGASTLLHREEIPPLAPTERRELVVRLDDVLRTLTAHVVDESGRSLSGATAKMSTPSGPTWTLTADDDGRLRLESVGRTPVDARVSKPGHATRFVTLEANDEETEVVLRPGVEVTLELVDAAGARVSSDGVDVTIVGAEPRERWEARPTDDGRWHVEGLPNVKLHVLVERDGEVTRRPLEAGGGERRVIVRE